MGWCARTLAAPRVGAKFSLRLLGSENPVSYGNTTAAQPGLTHPDSKRAPSSNPLREMGYAYYR
jgi:hypothetical protein